jgi:hypothetical protein
LPHSYGQIAQSVEQRTENPCVAGSIPVLANFFPKKLDRKNAKVLAFLGIEVRSWLRTGGLMKTIEHPVNVRSANQDSSYGFSVF